MFDLPVQRAVDDEVPGYGVSGRQHRVVDLGGRRRLHQSQTGEESETYRNNERVGGKDGEEP